MKECLNTMNYQSFNHKKLNSTDLSQKLQIIGSIKYDQKHNKSKHIFKYD